MGGLTIVGTSTGLSRIRGPESRTRARKIIFVHYCQPVYPDHPDRALNPPMVEEKSENEVGAQRATGWSAPTGRRTDEWSECLVHIGKSHDRAAFTRFFRHFAPLIKAFALAGSS